MRKLKATFQLHFDKLNFLWNRDYIPKLKKRIRCIFCWCVLLFPYQLFFLWELSTFKCWSNSGFSSLPFSFFLSKSFPEVILSIFCQFKYADSPNYFQFRNGLWNTDAQMLLLTRLYLLEGGNQCVFYPTVWQKCLTLSKLQHMFVGKQY